MEPMQASDEVKVQVAVDFLEHIKQLATQVGIFANTIASASGVMCDSEEHSIFGSLMDESEKRERAFAVQACLEAVMYNLANFRGHYQNAVEVLTGMEYPE